MESLPGDDISGWRLEDLGVALGDDAQFGIMLDIDGEVDLIAANKAASVGEEEDEHAFLTSSRRRRYEL